MFCPYCAKSCQKLCDDIKCKFCLKNSFASHSKSKYWSEENKVSPRQVIKASNKKYKFDCPECDQLYEARLSMIVCSGTWCNCVCNKTEALLYKYLQTIIDSDTKIIKQKKFNW